MIKELTLKGFKSFYDETLKISPLTVLTGLNSSGKSSVIQSLLMLRNRGPLEGHGTIEELTNIYYSTQFSIQIKYITPLGVEHYRGFGPEAQKVTRKVLGGPQFIYVSADRFGPRSSIPVYASSYRMGERGDNILQCIDYYEGVELDPHLIHENSEGDTFGYNLRAWLGSITPGVEFKHEIQKMSDSSYATFDGHRAVNVGFGLSYALPIIVALFQGTLMLDKRIFPVVLIENPEAHLHPKGQTEMARLICSAVEAGAQVIVETHSDHLFDGIRIYAKNHSGFAEKVATHWFELDKQKLTRVESPEMDDNGNLDFWPAGMFDQFGLNATELLG